MNFLLDVVKGDYTDSIIQTKGFLETLGFGSKMFLIGILTVFAVLGILFVFLTVFKTFFDKSENRPKKESKTETVVLETKAPTTNSNDSEIVAVIAAAIAAAESESSGLKFRVVSFRRK